VKENRLDYLRNRGGKEGKGDSLRNALWKRKEIYWEAWQDLDDPGNSLYATSTSGENMIKSSGRRKGKKNRKSPTASMRIQGLCGERGGGDIGRKAKEQRNREKKAERGFSLAQRRHVKGGVSILL